LGFPVGLVPMRVVCPPLPLNAHSFPFTLSIGLSDLRRHEGFHLHCQGLDMDMVSVRPAKIETPAKAPKRKPAKKTQKAAPSLFHEPDGPLAKTPVVPPVLQTVEPVRKPPSIAVPAEPELIGTVPDTDLVGAAQPERPAETPQVGQTRADRLATVGTLELPQEMPFHAPIAECVRLNHDGLDFACIALARDTIDAILWLICCIKLSPRQSKCADVRSQFGALSAIGVPPTSLKTTLEKLWYERVDYLRLNTADDLDRSALEGAAATHISALVELVRQLLGHSSDQGRVIPEHAEYWNQGRKKLPFKAATTG
jgi:hypothetical protein